MPNDEWLYPVPESILFEAIRNARDRGTPFTTNEACLSYMLDRKKECIRSVREYSRIWKWPYSTTRRRMREIEASVGKWATFYGANRKELTDPEKRTLAEQMAGAQGGSQVDHSRLTHGSKNGLKEPEKEESGSEVDQSRIRGGSQLLETETKKEKKEDNKGVPQRRKRRYPWKKSDVENIYQAYPRKVGKEKALSKIDLALRRLHDNKDGPDDAVAYLLDRVEVFAESPAGNRGKYTPHPATWFFQGRYGDDEKEWHVTDDEKTGATLKQLSDRQAREIEFARKAGIE